MTRGKTIFHLHFPTNFPLANRNWHPYRVGWADHVASLDTAVKRKISALPKNQNLTLRCSVDNPVRIVFVLTHQHKLSAYVKYVVSQQNRFDRNVETLRNQK